MLCVALSAMAKRGIPVQQRNTPIANSTTASKTTAVGDQRILKNTITTDTFTTYTYGADSGYLNGINLYADRAFAERYYINGADSSIKVKGFWALFDGKVSATSSNTVKFKVWKSGPQIAVTESMAFSGYPGLATDSVTVSVKGLGINAIEDTLKLHLLDTASATMGSSFFVGYEPQFTYATANGDTFGIASTKNGQRHTAPYNVVMNIDDFSDTTYDTIYTVQNATQYHNWLWADNYKELNGQYNHLIIFPVVIIGNPTGINSVQVRDLALYGCYPSPAVGELNITFSLLAPSCATITIYDISGKQVLPACSTAEMVGKQSIKINVSDLPKGNYIYTVATAKGDYLSEQFSKQ